MPYSPLARYQVLSAQQAFTVSLNVFLSLCFDADPDFSDKSITYTTTSIRLIRSSTSIYGFPRRSATDVEE